MLLGWPPTRRTMAHRPAIARRMLRPGVARAVAIVVAEIPLIGRVDQAASAVIGVAAVSTAPASHSACRHLRLPLLAELLMCAAIAALGR
jgi:hypothetical protein